MNPFIFFILIFFTVNLSVASANDTKDAANIPISYASDPIFTPIYPEEEHPLQGLFNLAQDQDARAQFILGDLFSKGKGGIAQNMKYADLLFQHSAKNGYPEAFIRLAALAQQSEQYQEAYKWHRLSIERQKTKDLRNWSRKEIKVLTKNKLVSFAEKKQARKDAKTWALLKLPVLDLKPLITPPPLNNEEGDPDNDKN